jgi:hypothetical protein
MNKFFLSMTLLLSSLFFARAEPQVQDIGTTTRTNVVVSTATNAVVYTNVNGGFYARSLEQFNLGYTAADSSTVTVQIANTAGVRLTWFAITNSSTTSKIVVPDTQYRILPGCTLYISNSVLTANTNVLQVLMGETYIK